MGLFCLQISATWPPSSAFIAWGLADPPASRRPPYDRTSIVQSSFKYFTVEDRMSLGVVNDVNMQEAKRKDITGHRRQR